MNNYQPFDPYMIDRSPEGLTRPGVVELFVTVMNDRCASVLVELANISNRFIIVWDYSGGRTYTSAYDMVAHCTSSCLPLRVVFNPAFRPSDVDTIKHLGLDGIYHVHPVGARWAPSTRELAVWLEKLFIKALDGAEE